MRKIINHHIEAGTRESHPRVQDLQHPRLCLQIWDTRRMEFPRPSLNVVLDSINPTLVVVFQSTTRLAESRMLQIFDTKMGFRVPALML